MLIKSLRSLRVVYDYKNIQLVKCPLLKSPLEKCQLATCLLSKCIRMIPVWPMILFDISTESHRASGRFSLGRVCRGRKIKPFRRRFFYRESADSSRAPSSAYCRVTGDISPHPLPILFLTRTDRLIKNNVCIDSMSTHLKRTLKSGQ